MSYKHSVNSVINPNPMSSNTWQYINSHIAYKFNVYCSSKAFRTEANAVILWQIDWSLLMQFLSCLSPAHSGTVAIRLVDVMHLIGDNSV
jgi:hypothetical protein